MRTLPKSNDPQFDGYSHKLVLQRMIEENHWTRGAEIGVEKGETHLHLLRHCPELNMLGVDVWQPQPEKDEHRDQGGYSYAGDNLPGHEERLRTIIDECYAGRSDLIKGRSVEVAKTIEDYSLDFVFIDASHLEQDVTADVKAWRQKVKPGGLMLGHDLHFPGVQKVVKDLCPGWQKLPQEMWSVVCAPIVAMSPYSDYRNLGRAHNEAMAMLPEDGWGCILDHDVMFTTQEWHRQLTKAVIAKPEGCFCAVTNRIKCPWQKIETVDFKNHNVPYHREIGQQLLKNETLRDVTDEVRTPAGFLMLLSKQAWREAGFFPEGLHYLDRIMWTALKESDRRIYLIEGLYLYHWHRGAGEPIQKGEWVVKHKLPNGKIIQLEKDRKELPVYDGEACYACH